MTQRSPCYPPLPDCSNYLSFCRTHYLTHYLILQINTTLLSSGQTFYQGAPADSIYFALYCIMRKLNNKKRQVMMFLLLFNLSSHFPFVSSSFLSKSIFLSALSFSFLSISILSMLPFSVLSLLFLSTYFSFSSLPLDSPPSLPLLLIFLSS